MCIHMSDILAFDSIYNEIIENYLRLFIVIILSRVSNEACMYIPV